jgi:hypothetical protein
MALQIFITAISSSIKMKKFIDNFNVFKGSNTAAPLFPVRVSHDTIKQTKILRQPFHFCFYRIN